jgi:maltokinase
VHHDLALAFGTEDVSAAVIAARIGDRLTDAAGEVPELVPLLPGLSTRLERATRLGRVAVQRVHGDLHLAQALFSGGRWLIGDFEGEPGAEHTSRVARDNPLRDVAGMLRSFDYMASVAAEHADLWRTAYPDAFVAGYVAAGGADAVAHTALLDAYLVDKAVYEVVYESRYRPDWLGIPLAAVRRMAR